MIKVKRVHKMGTLSMNSKRAEDEVKVYKLTPEQLAAKKQEMQDSMSPYEKHLRKVFGCGAI